MLSVGDVILMYLSLYLVLAVRYNDFSLFPGPQSRDFFLNFSVIHLVWLGLLYSFDFYDEFRNKNAVAMAKDLFLFAVLAFAFGVVYFYLNLHSLISPKTILFADVILFSLFIFLRSLFWGRVAGGKRFERKIAVAGWGPEMEELAANYLPRANYRVAAVFRPSSLDGFENLDIYTRGDDFIRAVKEKGVELIVLAVPQESRVALSDLLSNIDIDIKVVGLEGFYEEVAGKIPLRLIDKFWVMEIIPRTSRKGYMIIKRTFDVFFSFLGLLATAIIFPLAALAIKIDSRGPVFYVQNRKGKGGRTFKFYKFRTMTATDEQYSVWRTGRDEQVTRVGKILKKAHIDEFPQFFNILRGDISFVGPRPEWDRLALDYEKKISLYRYRYLVRPGFTGWAQINYKASTSIKEAEEKFEYDLYYIKNRSFVLDISIIAKTIQLFFR